MYVGLFVPHISSAIDGRRLERVNIQNFIHSNREPSPISSRLPRPSSVTLEATATVAISPVYFADTHIGASPLN